jgi:hypothetical protein
MAEIAGNDSQAQPPLHPVVPVIATGTPAIIASQTGNAPLEVLLQTYWRSGKLCFISRTAEEFLA